MGAGEVFEEVGVVGFVQVDVGVGGIFGLCEGGGESLQRVEDGGWWMGVECDEWKIVNGGLK